jgi:hypothetical protein
MNGYVQTRCPRCGNAAWGHPMQAVPCNSCGQQVPPMAQPQGWGAAPGLGSFGAAPGMQPPAAAQQQPQAWGAPPPVANGQPPGMGGFGQPAPGFGQQPPQGQQAAAGGAPKMNVNLPYGIKLPINIGGKHMKLKIIGGVILAIAVAVGGVVFKKTRTPKGMLSYASLGLSGKPDADAAYANLAKDAGKWKKDAILWSVNFQAVRADGTIDVGRGAEVVYVSPDASSSHAKSVRSDSVRKYGLSASGVKPAKYGWNDVVEGIEAHPEPQCKIKDVVELLKKQGLSGDKTVRITFDPKFADFYAWRVIGSDPKIDALFGWSDCQPIK